MLRKTWIGLLVSLLFVAMPASARSPEAELRALADSYAERRGFNGTVLVARGGRILLRASYGLADTEGRRPGRPDLSYRIGSLTKPLTATLVMTLVQQHKLRLEGTLGEYLPDLYAGTAAAPVTIAQLLNHTSGLADVPARFDDPWWKTSAREQWMPAAFARRWVTAEPVEAPGTKWRYNNNGYFLLGLIVERVTGKSYADNLRDRIFEPAGMTHSGLFTRTTDLAGFARGYAVTPAGLPAAPDAIDPSVSFSAAGIYSTVDDIFRFDRALYGTRLLDAGSRAAMFTARAGSYGLGWNVDDYKLPDGRRLPVVSHTGSVPGYQSYYLRSEPQQDCVIILDNFWQGLLVVQMGQDLLEVLNGAPVQLPRYALADLISPLAYTGGVDAMVAAYTALGARESVYDLREQAFNSLGYKLLRDRRVPEAVQVFRWGTERYPQSANGYDSLGEAYRAAGQDAAAIASYQRALALDPTSKSARAALADLRAAPVW